MTTLATNPKAFEKLVWEEYPIWVNFQTKLATGDQLISASVTAYKQTGEADGSVLDAGLTGAIDSEHLRVRVWVKAGAVGEIYNLITKAVSQEGAKLALITEMIVL